MNSNGLPTTIPAYLAQLRRSLAGADPAMIQDALYDAEEYLRAELAAHPGKGEAEVIADVAGSYGAPEEVADIYRETEATVQAALHTPSPRSPAAPRVDMAQASGTAAAPAVTAAGGGVLHKVFGVFVDPRTYGALFYMLLALATGVFYFTWTVTGLSVTLGTMVLIIGLPLFLLFIAASRVLALVEGRIVEVMLGERMPRRPLYSDTALPLLERIKRMFTDPRTWSAFAYFLLMLPLGVVYFTIVVAGLTTSLVFLAAPLTLLWGHGHTVVFGAVTLADAPWLAPLLMLAGAAILVLLMHLARGIGRLHGQLAKAMLVKIDAAD